MDHPANPAGRLFLFFEAVAPRDRGQPAVTQLSAMWGLTFPDDWYTAIGRLRRLQGDATVMCERLTELDDPAGNVLLGRLGHIESVLRDYTANTSSTLSMLADQADPAVRLALESASALLDARWRDPVLEQDTIDNLLANLDSVTTQVTNADDIDRFTKTWLLHRLDDIVRALHDYKVNGYEAFERATDELVGGLQVRPGLITRIAQSSTAHGIGILLTLLSQTVQTAASVKELAAGPDKPHVVVVLEYAIDQAQQSLALPSTDTVSDAATPDPAVAQP